MANTGTPTTSNAVKARCAMRITFLQVAKPRFIQRKGMRGRTNYTLQLRCCVLVKSRPQIRRPSRVGTALKCVPTEMLCPNRGRLPAPRVERKMVGHLRNLAADSIESSVVVALVESLGDPASDLPHFGFFHPTRCECGRADANAGWLERRVGVVW